ncbi:MAG: hypothetical protein WKG07_07760 [Hymenobacter sp.]
MGSAVHPLGYLSPYFQTLGLEKHGLEWILPPASVAHPLDGQEAVLLSKSIAETAANLGVDAGRYQRLLAPFQGRTEELLRDALKPLGLPHSPLLLARFGLKAALPATLFQELFSRANGRGRYLGAARRTACCRLISCLPRPSATCF